MENILENLNKEQLDAAKTTKGALLILAGAGSGKSFDVTYCLYDTEWCNSRQNSCCYIH